MQIPFRFACPFLQPLLCSASRLRASRPRDGNPAFVSSGIRASVSEHRERSKCARSNERVPRFGRADGFVPAA